MITVLVRLPFWAFAVLWLLIGYLLSLVSLYVYSQTNGFKMDQELLPTHIRILSNMFFIGGVWGFIKDFSDWPGLYAFLCSIGMPIKLFFTLFCTLIYLMLLVIRLFSFLPEKIKNKKY